MASVKFHLKKRKTEGLRSMYLMAYVNGARIKLYPGIRALEKEFNSKTQKFISPKLTRNEQLFLDKEKIQKEGQARADDLNRQKDLIETKIKHFLIECEAQERIPTKEELDFSIGRKERTKVVSRVSLKDQFDKFLDSPVRGKMGIKKRENSSLRSVRALWKHIEGYQAAKNIKLNKWSFDNEFIQEFEMYLSDTDGGDLKDSTKNKTLKDLKAFLRFCQKDGYITYELPEIIVEKLDSSYFNYLEEDELEAFESVDLEENSTLSKARDIFLAQIYSGGQRISDIKRLNQDWIQKGRLVFVQKKTLKKMDIPISNKLWEILLKYEMSLPKLTEQEINRSLKEIGQMAKLFATVHVIKSQGGKQEEEYIPKYQLLSSHDARRTFIMLALNRGMNIPDVRSYTGHKDLKSFQIYLDRVNSKKSDERFLKALNQGEEVSNGIL